ncbi:MAG TPA: hypothetical protein ENH01_08080 [Nitrospirae bacterium]|nr:hypothetical protein [Nitrospirota bacterium]
MYNLVSFAGIFVLMAFAWAFSTNRRVINWRLIIWGCILQIIFFASLMAVLYYAGIMSWLVKIFAKIFTKLMRVSGAKGAFSGNPCLPHDSLGCRGIFQRRINIIRTVIS